MKHETIFRAYIKARDRMETAVSNRRNGLWAVEYREDYDAARYRKHRRQAETFEAAIWRMIAVTEPQP